MDETQKQPNNLFSNLPKLSTVLVVVVIGALAGVGVYQAAVQGWLPLSVSLPKLQINNQTQTILNEESDVINVVKKTSKSVVAIGATKQVLNPFDPFAAPKNQSSTIGTGFIVSDKGIIVTNKHVVSDPNATYSVITSDGKKYEIRKIYRDPILDLAVVQIDSSDLSALELGDSSKLQVGQTAIAIGNALGQFTNTVTTGVISGLGRKVVAGDPFSGSSESLDNLIQTSAAINPGNSGGPLLNSAGQVVGVNVATSEGAQNIGFAIPINSVKKIVDEFVQKGTVSRPFLGINYRFISKDVALLNEVPQGVYVQSVVSGSAADKAGIQSGDIITKINGQAVDSESKISDTIASKNIGESITLTVWSSGKSKDVKATLQELPNQ
ncbi:trypsin-like peptidase domain-containing protein [Candidatus Daviesbacteria bacterium]|nr:trypsin-like peptidase domain-containing protein [Candidatus Daviesbacteria bacterium]